MPLTIWHRFSSQLLMPFQMVWSVLLTVLHLKTLLLIGCEISTANQNLTNEWFLTKHTIWKSIEVWTENWWHIDCGILFNLIYSMTSSEEICLAIIWHNRSWIFCCQAARREKKPVVNILLLSLYLLLSLDQILLKLDLILWRGFTRRLTWVGWLRQFSFDWFVIKYSWLILCRTVY